MKRTKLHTGANPISVATLYISEQRHPIALQIIGIEIQNCIRVLGDLIRGKLLVHQRIEGRSESQLMCIN